MHKGFHWDGSSNSTVKWVYWYCVLQPQAPAHLCCSCLGYFRTWNHNKNCKDCSNIGLERGETPVESLLGPGVSSIIIHRLRPAQNTPEQVIPLLHLWSGPNGFVLTISFAIKCICFSNVIFCRIPCEWLNSVSPWKWCSLGPCKQERQIQSWNIYWFQST